MKTVRLIFGICFVVGLGLLAGGFYSVQHTRQFLRTAVEAPGVVTENLRQDSSSSDRSGGSWSYYPRIRFRTSDGQEIVFISNTGTSSPVYRVNEPVTVLYDPRQPHHAFIKSFAQVWMLSMILCGVGAVLSLSGIGAVVWKGAGNRKNAWLRQNGRRIQAEITRVELDTSLEVTGKHPYRIVCQWLDPARNEVHTFHSANIWFDPTKYIPGKTIEVLVDPDNLRRYAVETAFLPKVV
jgi:hypothetical protein